MQKAQNENLPIVILDAPTDNPNNDVDGTKPNTPVISPEVDGSKAETTEVGLEASKTDTVETPSPKDQIPRLSKTDVENIIFEGKLTAENEAQIAEYIRSIDNIDEVNLLLSALRAQGRPNNDPVIQQLNNKITELNLNNSILEADTDTQTNMQRILSSHYNDSVEIIKDNSGNIISIKIDTKEYSLNTSQNGVYEYSRVYEDGSIIKETITLDSNGDLIIEQVTTRYPENDFGDWNINDATSEVHITSIKPNGTKTETHSITRNAETHYIEIIDGLRYETWTEGNTSYKKSEDGRITETTVEEIEGGGTRKTKVEKLMNGDAATDIYTYDLDGNITRYVRIENGTKVVYDYINKQYTIEQVRYQHDSAPRDLTYQVEQINPNEIYFTQRSMGENYADIRVSFEESGWQGKPIDVIRTNDGKYISMDNRRLAAAREAGIDVHVVIHDVKEPLTAGRRRQFMIIDSDGRVVRYPETWGEAIFNRLYLNGLADDAGRINYADALNKPNTEVDIDFLNKRTILLSDLYTNGNHPYNENIFAGYLIE